MSQARGTSKKASDDPGHPPTGVPGISPLPENFFCSSWRIARYCNVDHWISGIISFVLVLINPLASINFIFPQENWIRYHWKVMDRFRFRFQHRWEIIIWIRLKLKVCKLKIHTYYVCHCWACIETRWDRSLNYKEAGTRLSREAQPFLGEHGPRAKPLLDTTDTYGNLFWVHTHTDTTKTMHKFDSTFSPNYDVSYWLFHNWNRFCFPENKLD
jgi:hypothetical protein